MAASYGFERHSTFQRSRQAIPGPEFVDPRRDWSTDATDNVHYFMANLDLVRVLPRLDLRFGYDFNRSRPEFLYVVPPDGTLLPPLQLPPVRVSWHALAADARYQIGRRVALGLTYWHDQYRAEDFAMSPETLPTVVPPGAGAVVLRYLHRDYTANSVWLRAIYFW
jgi:hypothetical protein